MGDFDFLDPAQMFGSFGDAASGAGDALGLPPLPDFNADLAAGAFDDDSGGHGQPVFAPADFSTGGVSIQGPSFTQQQPSLGVYPMPAPPRGGFGIAGLLRAISARVGQRVTVRDLVSLAVRFGIAAATQMTGVPPATLATIVVKRRRRRGRGISARQIRNARGVIRKMQSFNKLLHLGGFARRAHASPARPFTRRRRR